MARVPPADAGERLWLTYYESIFNPARLKVTMMQKEMPKRYWPNLPEGALIAWLVAGAAERTAAMIGREPTHAAKKRPAARRPTPGHVETAHSGRATPTAFR
jgi:hypothetical protein